MYLGVLVAEQNITVVYNIFNQRRGRVVEEYHMPGVPFYHIKAFIPVVKYIGLSSALKTCEAFSQFAAKIFDEIRAFKGLEEKIRDILSKFETSLEVRVSTGVRFGGGGQALVCRSCGGGNEEMISG
ncbi:hypothetical protein CTI12_AA070380 [Artemisia annua]|uniref:Uncharacterized protein n=1 Tax=Artemisia annua TaxID=35608 RepID=A0A2U1Q5W3_ARTAN|nr:hypothetical protein CTI12_AA070380 [Artemisia annua]